MIQAGAAGAETPVTLRLPAGVVHGKVDLLDPLTEIKTTRSNDLKQPAYGMPQYIEQLAAYALATGNMGGSVVVWYIFAMPPVLRVWDIQFTPEELQDFAVELDYRLHAISQSDIIPPLGEHRRGECKSCPYLKKGCAGDSDGGRENFFNQSNYTPWNV